MWPQPGLRRIRPQTADRDPLPRPRSTEPLAQHHLPGLPGHHEHLSYFVIFLIPSCSGSPFGCSENQRKRSKAKSPIPSNPETQKSKSQLKSQTDSPKPSPNQRANQSGQEKCLPVGPGPNGSKNYTFLTLQPVKCRAEDRRVSLRREVRKGCRLPSMAKILRRHNKH